ncbi:protein dehydratase [Actinobacillus delphinicola]|uniref:Flp pilus assembly protein n=1 Tax=Actinobacillus delphinicola TaxID=51161 RepID=A0A448TWA2_9PAST|nr:type II secretion system F family protein [Actinobacillus delphinicola]MDG6896765.1 protein dehydratase [Actinobacillus delphinicola]VEJ10197.1 Flp pilus assembly protein [Actinobacillus delphinicola]
MILYYIIFCFGGLLLLYTFKRFSKTKRKINPNETKVSPLQTAWQKTKQQAALWHYYFIDGKQQNLMRNVLIVCIVYFITLIINTQFIRFNSFMVTAIFAVLFVITVWKWGRRRNRKDFEVSFPEVIQVLNSATTAGAGLLQALERCGRDIKGRLGDEFKYIYRRLAIGEDVTTVLEDSYTRWPYKEFYYFITIVRINLEKGGQMKEVINRLGRVIADSRKMEQKKRAMTSEARMSAMIVGAFPLFFFIFMKFQMPENFDFVISDPKGRLVLYYVLGSELFGMGIIWWLMKKAT